MLTVTLATAGLISYFGKQVTNFKIEHQAIEIDGKPYNHHVFDNITGIPGNSYKVSHTIYVFTDTPVNISLITKKIDGVSVEYYLNGVLFNQYSILHKGEYDLTTIYMLDIALSIGNYRIETTLLQSGE